MNNMFREAHFPKHVILRGCLGFKAYEYGDSPIWEVRVFATNELLRPGSTNFHLAVSLQPPNKHPVSLPSKFL